MTKAYYVFEYQWRNDEGFDGTGFLLVPGHYDPPSYIAGYLTYSDELGSVKHKGFKERPDLKAFYVSRVFSSPNGQWSNGWHEFAKSKADVIRKAQGAQAEIQRIGVDMQFTVDEVIV